MLAPAFASKWLDWTPKTPSQRTDSTDSFEDNPAKSAENRGSIKEVGKAGLPQKTSTQRTDTAGSLQTVGTVSSLNRRFEENISPAPEGPQPHRDSIRTRFEERAAIAEYDGGLSRTDAELLAWNEVRTCVVCLQETQGESDAVRLAGGGWLHHERCYDRYFKFRQ